MMATFNTKTMKLIGTGERSKVYQHPSDSGKVVKVTKSPSEKKVIKFIHANPRSWFVKVYSFEMVGPVMYAVMEKLPDVEFVRFETIDTAKTGKLFYESKYTVGMSFEDATKHYNPEAKKVQIAQYIGRRVKAILAPEADVREYYALLMAANEDCFWIPDVAWNLGRRSDGTLCCYDATM